MGFLSDLFRPPPYPKENKTEVNQLLNELLVIGKKEDFLSERPGPPFNGKCRHIRARAIGIRLDEIGGLLLMDWIHSRVKKKLGKDLAAHLEYCWTEVGHWLP